MGVEQYDASKGEQEPALSIGQIQDQICQQLIPEAGEGNTDFETLRDKARQLLTFLGDRDVLWTLLRSDKSHRTVPEFTLAEGRRDDTGLREKVVLVIYGMQFIEDPGKHYNDFDLKGVVSSPMTFMKARVPGMGNNTEAVLTAVREAWPEYKWKVVGEEAKRYQGERAFNSYTLARSHGLVLEDMYARLAEQMEIKLKENPLQMDFRDKLIWHDNDAEREG